MKSYYYVYKGIIEGEDKHFDQAESYFNKALGLKLRTTNDVALVYMYLSEVKIDRGQKEDAVKYIQLAKETPHKEQLDDFIQKVEEKILNMDHEN